MTVHPNDFSHPVGSEGPGVPERPIYPIHATHPVPPLDMTKVTKEEPLLPKWVLLTMLAVCSVALYFYLSDSTPVEMK